ncbi:MAG: VOC family protein [Candidatus Hodarchaeales archaeon]|jgi:catechol 2,3-dioxygenase-like lactoylglutathione lyase family enzyme
MKFGHLELFVDDPLRSQEFYCRMLGFEVIANQKNEFIWIKQGDIEILLKQGSPKQSPSYQDANHGIVMYTNDLEETADALKMKGLEFKGTDGSEKCLTFTDPDGHWFQLVNPEDH